MLRGTMMIAAKLMTTTEYAATTPLVEVKGLGNSAKILEIYLKHTNRVNTVKWLQTYDKTEEYHFISGSDDGLAIFWDIEQLTEPLTFERKGHESGVNAVTGLQYCTGEWLLATAAADSTVKLWSYKHQKNVLQSVQTISLNRGFCFTLKLTRLPNTEQVLLIFSTDDRNIDLWVNSVDNKQTFQQVHKLKGHEDWVRGLDFAEVKDGLLLASCSQDNSIRLWRLCSRSKEQVLNNKSDVFNVLGVGDIRMEEKIAQFAKSWYAISVESVLYWHEDWVYGIHWHKSKNQDLCLLSSGIWMQQLLFFFQAHHLTVKRVQFRPQKKGAIDYYELASCGEDHLVRIYAIQFKGLHHPRYDLPKPKKR
uniref:Elongator complex protein 2 n=1 Tax=Glossina morsitans morsitans TaxID=37546 RepID=A0A1B0FJH2_GLOMM